MLEVNAAVVVDMGGIESKVVPDFLVFLGSVGLTIVEAGGCFDCGCFGTACVQ